VTIIYENIEHLVLQEISEGHYAYYNWMGKTLHLVCAYQLLAPISPLGLYVGNVLEFDSVLNEMHTPRVGNLMVGNLTFNLMYPN